MIKPHTKAMWPKSLCERIRNSIPLTSSSLGLFIAGLVLAGSVQAADPVRAAGVPTPTNAKAENWIDPIAVDRLKAVALGQTTDSVRLFPLWQVDEVSATELTDLERDEVLTTLDTLIKSRLPSAGPPTLRLEVMVREVWRPSRLFNMLMFLVPIPGSGPLFATRGGISIEASVLDLNSGTQLARINCRKRGGLSSMQGIFGRVSDANAAMQHCAERIVHALATGQMPDHIPAAEGQAGESSSQR
jgi:hypothetical protein